MTIKNLLTPVAATLILTAACSPSEENSADGTLPDAAETTVSEIDAAEIPEGIAAAADAKISGMKITEVERKEREGKVFFDVEGTRPDGSEVELDMLEEDGAYTVVEVQRDIPWAYVPATARAAAPEALFTPVRVIESVQNDGTIIYELFEDGKPNAPSAEISVKNGNAKMLTDRWKY